MKGGDLYLPFRPANLGLFDVVITFAVPDVIEQFVFGCAVMVPLVETSEETFPFMLLIDFTIPRIPDWK